MSKNLSFPTYYRAQVCVLESVLPSYSLQSSGLCLGICPSLLLITELRFMSWNLSLPPTHQRAQVYVLESVPPSYPLHSSGLCLGICHSLLPITELRFMFWHLSLHPHYRAQVCVQEYVPPNSLQSSGLCLGICPSFILITDLQIVPRNIYLHFGIRCHYNPQHKGHSSTNYIIMISDKHPCKNIMSELHGSSMRTFSEPHWLPLMFL